MLYIVLWSLVLSILTHQSYHEKNLALDSALQEAKHRLANGEWYENTADLIKPYIINATLANKHLSNHLKSIANQAIDILEDPGETIIQVMDEFDAVMIEEHQHFNKTVDKLNMILDDAEDCQHDDELEPYQNDYAKYLTEFVMTAKPDMLIQQRIPAPKELDALIYGFQAFGEVRTA